MTTFYLVEHGEADYALAEGRRLRGHGWDLVPLTARGVEQIEATVATLRGLGIEVLLSSPMTRALQSASIIGRRLDLPVTVELDLREWSPDLTGSYDTVAAVRAASAEYARFDGEWPSGETRAWEPRSMLLDRVRGVLNRYTHLERAIVICHGYVIHALTGQTASHGSVYELRERI